MSLATYFAVFAVMVLGSTVQASIGFGQGLVSAPLLRLLHPELLPGPIVFAAVFTSLIVISRNSERGDLGELIPAFIGRFVGIGMALVLLATLSDRGLTIFIGALVLSFVIARMVGIGVPRRPRVFAVAGCVSGVSGSIAALGGAPMALVLEQHAAARDFRGPMGIYQAVGAAVTFAALAAFGEVGWTGVGLGLALLPPIVVGGYIARWATPIVDRGYLRPIVLGLSGASALVLLGGELLF